MAKMTKLDNNEVKFELEIPTDRFEEGLNIAWKQTANRYPISGFRKGKAPRKMIEKKYGSTIFYEQAFNEMFWEPYMRAVEESDIVPVSRPSIVIDKLEEGEPVLYTATVAVKPEIKLLKKNYKGIEVDGFEYDIDEAEIEHELQHQLERLARYESVERPVKEHDRVIIDYLGKVDGVPFEGGSAESQSLDVGSGMFIPGFEEQIIGKNVGDSFDVTVTFPQEYHAEDLAGKEAVFTVNLHEIKEKILPELDDEFAKDLGEFDTLAEHRTNLREKLKERNEERSKQEMTNAMLEKLVELNEFDVPEAMVDDQVQNVIQDMRYRLAQQGMSLEDYLGFTGSSIEQFQQEIRPDAEKRVHADLIIEKVIEMEEITVGEEELDERVLQIAKDVNKSLEETKELLKSSDFKAIEHELKVRAAIDFIFDKAKKKVRKFEKEVEKEDKKLDKELKSDEKIKEKAEKEKEKADKEIEKLVSDAVKELEKDDKKEDKK